MSMIEWWRRTRGSGYQFLAVPILCLVLSGCSLGETPEPELAAQPWIGTTIELVESVHVWHRIDPAILTEHAGDSLEYAALLEELAHPGDPTINTLVGDVAIVHVPTHWADLRTDSASLLVGLLQAESTGRTEIGIAVALDRSSISIYPAGSTADGEAAVAALAQRTGLPVNEFFVKAIESNPSQFVDDVFVEINR